MSHQALTPAVLCQPALHTWVTEKQPTVLRACKTFFQSMSLENRLVDAKEEVGGIGMDWEFGVN